ncbi:MAG: sulfotransferase [Acidimicrobiia bacterium]|nr:sulfotransferase [Acidimicrobiia bacterium]
MSDRTALSQQRYGFVLGTGRCGSTLVHELLARHPDVGFVTNVDDRIGTAATGRVQAALYRRLPAAATQKGRLRLAPSEAYRALEREVSPLLAESARDLDAADAVPWLASRFETFFATRAAAFGAPLFLHKFTGWPRARFIDRVLPGARYVHIVRDGRAVAASWLQTDWWRGHLGPSGWHFGPLPDDYEKEWEASGRSFVLLAGLAWKLLLDAFDEARREIDDERWLELRYEDVLADPRARTGEMLDFLGLSWTDEFEAGFGAFRFDSGRARAWREALGDEASAELDVSLADHLARRGYEV